MHKEQEKVYMGGEAGGRVAAEVGILQRRGEGGGGGGSGRGEEALCLLSLLLSDKA
jgi:hypothetical protein